MTPRHLPPPTTMETLAKVFLVNLPGSAENGPFLATDRILSPQPELSAQPNRHHWMQRLRADQVLAIYQVFSSRGRNAIALKGPMERNLRPTEA